MTEHKTLTEALAAFQADLPDVSKGSTNPAFNSRYADLADVVKVVLPKLAQHGLAWITAPDVTETGQVLRWELRHTSGDNLTGVWPLPDKANAQQLGSWITYGRRYCLSAVVGIAPDTDDDGNTASAQGAPRPQARTQPKTRPSDVVAGALAAIEGAKTAAELDEIEDKAKTRQVIGVESVKTALEAKRRELGQSGSDPWKPQPLPDDNPLHYTAEELS